MKKLSFALMAVALLATACGLNAADSQATVAAQVAATVAAQPPQQIPVQVPVTVQVPVEVPMTVMVEVTAIPAPTQVVQPADTQAAAATPAPAATTGPVVSTNPQDPLAGANPTPIIQEDFVIPDYWYQFDTSTGKGEIAADGTYLITVKEPERIEWTFNGKKTSNIYLTGKTILPDQKCKAGDNWGLVFRFRDNANFYLFGVSCDGKYRLMRRVDGLFEPLVDFTDSSAILKLGQKNVVGVRAVGDQISLYVNDQFLTTVTDGTFSEGLIGMYVKSQLTPNMTVVFDDITVYAINQ